MVVFECAALGFIKVQYLFLLNYLQFGLKLSNLIGSFLGFGFRFELHHFIFELFPTWHLVPIFYCGDTSRLGQYSFSIPL